ncbi:13846_t:CDS:2, partial [Cetraspora pellucida]
KCQEAETGCTISNEDHYMPFCEIYDKDTSEKYHPSLLQKINVPLTLPTTTIIDGLGTNEMVLYSQHHLNPEEENLLKNFLETINYTCGTTFYGISDLTKTGSPPFSSDNNYSINNNVQDVDNGINDDGDYDDDVDNSINDDGNYYDDGDYSDDGDYGGDVMEDGKRSVDESFTKLQNTKNDLSLEILFKRVFVNAKLICSTLMEVPYFSSHLYSDVCFQCGDTEIFSPTPAGE